MRFLRIQTIRKFIFTVFLLYLCWYKESRTDVPIILYGSVLLLTVSCLAGLPTRRIFSAVHPVVKILIVYGVFAFFSGLIVATDRSLFVSSMITYFEFIIVLLDCSIISYRDESWEWILGPIVIVAFVCMVQTIFWGQPYFNSGVVATTMSPQNNPNSLAHVILMGMYALVATRKRAMNRFVFKGVLMLVFIYVIFLTGSRKFLLSAGIFLLLWVYALLTDKGEEGIAKKLTIFLGIVACCIAGGWYITKYYLGSDTFLRMMKLFSDDESNFKRITMYTDGITLWKDHPILGIGFNQYRVFSQFGTYSHSTYIEVLSCTGIIGLFILFVPLIRYFFGIIRNLRTRNAGKLYVVRMTFAAMIVELFLGVGSIWLYGFSHMCFLMTILGIFDDWRMEDEYIENQNSY